MYYKQTYIIILIFTLLASFVGIISLQENIQIWEDLSYKFILLDGNHIVLYNFEMLGFEKDNFQYELKISLEKNIHRFISPFLDW